MKKTFEHFQPSVPSNCFHMNSYKTAVQCSAPLISESGKQTITTYVNIIDILVLNCMFLSFLCHCLVTHCLS